MYWDINSSRWMRAGKVIGRAFGVRNGEHAKGALLTTPENRDSEFYSGYPSKHANLHDKAGVRGYFENLQQYVALGVDPDLPTGDLLEIFDIDEATNRNIAKTNIRGASDLAHKQRHLFGYLWELTYALAIAPRDNIFSNPGIEALLGIFHPERG